jgi:hypothetical protein
MREDAIVRLERNKKMEVICKVGIVDYSMSGDCGGGRNSWWGKKEERKVMRMKEERKEKRKKMRVRKENGTREG